MQGLYATNGIFYSLIIAELAVSTVSKNVSKGVVEVLGQVVRVLR